MQRLFLFLRREGFAEVTGTKVNIGASYELEIPCVYRLYMALQQNERTSRLAEPEFHVVNNKLIVGAVSFWPWSRRCARM